MAKSYKIKTPKMSRFSYKKALQINVKMINNKTLKLSKKSRHIKLSNILLFFIWNSNSFNRLFSLMNKHLSQHKIFQIFSNNSSNNKQKMQRQYVLCMLNLKI